MYTTTGCTPHNNYKGYAYSHHSCYNQWLKSIPGTRENFNTLFGECLYCNHVSLLVTITIIIILM